MPPTPVLVVDFDDTITEGDTIGLLINAAIQAQSRGEPTTQETQERQEAQRALKNRLVSEYVEAFQVLVQRHLPENTHRKDTGLNMEHISGFLDDLNDFEIRMNSKVTDSGILAGLQEADIEGVARAVSVRQHARETIKAALQKGWQVHVLSVNWSAALIRAVLAGIPSRIDREGADNLTLDAGDQQAVVIHANSLEMQFGISTGNINCSVQGPLDKGNILEDLLLDIAAASGDGSSPCVYIGDSVGDLSALLVANRPVVLGNNAMLQHALHTFGCQLAPVAGTGVSLTDNPLTPGSVLHADSWLQIFEWLFPAATLGGAASPGRASNAAPTTPPAGGSMNRAASHTISAGDSGRHPETPGTAHGTFTDLDAPAEATPPTPGLASTAQHTPALPRVASGVSTGVATGPPTGAAAPRSTTPARVLVIAGSDSGGGAGIQADVRACMANHAYAATAISALTVQNSHGVHGVHVPPVDTVEEQMTAVLGDIGADAIKTGMLPTAEIVRKVAQVITEHKEKRSEGMPVVVDPVLVSTSGSSLSEDSAVAAMKAALLPVATVLTPNLTEASTLLGGREISTVQHMRDAARDLAKLGPQAILIKGGHLPPSPPVDPPTADPTATPSDPHKSGSAGAPLTERAQSDDAAATAITVTPPGVTRISVSLDAPAQPSAQLVVDVLYDSSTGETVDLPTPRVDTPNTHGTGCTLASALAARLAQGTSLVAAVNEAQQYVHACIADSVCLSLGSGPQGAMDHGAGLCAPTSATGVKGGATGGVTGGLREPPGVWGESIPAPVVVEPEQRTLDYAVYVVTDPGMNTTCNRSTGEAVAAAIKGGATVVQIREKNLDGCCFLERVRDALEVARPAGVPVIVNDRVDVALAAGADGVHIGQDDLPCLEVRRMIGDRMILGVSAANSTEARKAAEEGADYVGVGAVYATTTKEDSTAIGLKGLEEVVKESPLPVVAIGGINHDNVAKVMGSGCAGVAVVSCVFATPDVEQAVRNLRGKMGLNEAVSAAE